MNNFSINRFAKTLWWVICVNARTLLLWCVAAITLVVFIGEILFQEMNSYGDPWSAIHNFSQLAAGLFIIVSLIMISLFAFGINDKRKRATFLMLPSSNLEKFLSLVVFTTVIGIACLFLAIVLGDSLRMAWYWLSGYQGPRMECVEMDGVTYHWWSSAIPQLIKESRGHNEPDGTPNGLVHCKWYAHLRIVVVASLLLYAGRNAASQIRFRGN